MSRMAILDKRGPETGEPQIMGAPDSHDALWDLLSKRAPCKVLDAAAGQGVLAKRLRDEGWDVHCADIMAELLP